MKRITPIAIVGMGGVFPGALNLDEYWGNIARKINLVEEIPEGRSLAPLDFMCAPRLAPDKAISRRACLIHNFVFDPAGYGLDAGLLQALDPLYHLALTAGKAALASVNRETVDPQRAGVVLAAIALPTDASSGLCRKVMGQALEIGLFGEAEADTAPLTREECLAARVAGLPGTVLASGLGLKGGAYTLDAACASSLYALYLACEELKADRADLMLAGGLSRPDCLYTQVGFSQLRALSPSGRCAPFDETADGLVVGEGAGLVALKRLEDALRDGDAILGLIRGIGLSNDMRGNLLAPDSEGQVRAMQQAYRAAGWRPSQADLIECHGAGTPVGDRTEIQSMIALWGDSGWHQGQCPIGSVKSMIGHLLTAAGAAGLIKTLLAMSRQLLPPSMNFTRPPADSPLSTSPFRVQTETADWRPQSGQPRRAAISAFGFGGINAHVLVEQYRDQGLQRVKPAAAGPRLEPTLEIAAPCAIIGMGACFGELSDLERFRQAVFNGRSAIQPRPEKRFKGAETAARRYLGKRAGHGAYLTPGSAALRLDSGRFRTPPNEIPDIIAQQLLMLKVAAEAMADAGIPADSGKPRMGCVIGMDFDMEATDFHLRWDMVHFVRAWGQRAGLNDAEIAQWLSAWQDAVGAPLTHARTLGALGVMAAGRVAREFRLGGPSFTVSEHSASGLRALDIAVRMLQQNMIDAALVGAVDIAGDLRNIISLDGIQQFSAQSRALALDAGADGPLPGEGAAALILIRAEDAQRDGRRIYALVNGLGHASRRNGALTSPDADAYRCSVEQALQAAGVVPADISFIESASSGQPEQTEAEAQALASAFHQVACPAAVGALAPVIGHAGAAAGLASLIKTALCLYHEILPPVPGFVRPQSPLWENSPFHVPILPQYWFRDRADGPRRALAGNMTWDGHCVHVVLEQAAETSDPQLLAQIREERRYPLGVPPLGLVAVAGDTPAELLKGLDRLAQAVQESPTMSVFHFAAQWRKTVGDDRGKRLAAALVAESLEKLPKLIDKVRKAVAAGTSLAISGAELAAYAPEPLGSHGEIAFVFPGSGNHYLGMGREIGIYWPEIFRQLDQTAARLKTQAAPQVIAPWRVNWEPGWESQARAQIAADPLSLIFGQVLYGCLMAELMRCFRLGPQAVMGYSLGESAGYFAMGVWRDQDQMLARMQGSELFKTLLAGPYHALRKAWGLAEHETIQWRVAVVNRPPGLVREALNIRPYARLLIVNTEEESVIGGLQHEVEAVIRELKAGAVYLEGVVAVHCDAAAPVAEAYRELHVFPTHAPAGIRFYSCAQGLPLELTTENAADSILNQALHGFDFTSVVRRAYQDGARIFIELGPRASCARMIDSILGTRPHKALAISAPYESEVLTLFKALATLIAERAPLDLELLSAGVAAEQCSKSFYEIRLGGEVLAPPLPVRQSPPPAAPEIASTLVVPGFEPPPTVDERPEWSELLTPLTEQIQATAQAHQTFLQFSAEQVQAYGQTFIYQAELLEYAVAQGELAFTDRSMAGPLVPAAPEPAFSREMCLEFAIGRLERVLGPAFAVVDAYPARVRLPDEPLMLVDRILSVTGEKASLTAGTIVTEHDVLPQAWYLDGQRAPVCIAVEAGQADLFLCSYLGIDLMVKGQRTYRLLDAEVVFHRGLPRPGETIRYEIQIDRFVRQGDTWLFFFRFEGSIAGEPLITMRDGCAGFFTPAEVENSGGIILTETEKARETGHIGVPAVVPMRCESYSESDLAALRRGDLAAAFGPLFAGAALSPSLRLPDGKMRLIHRILELDPAGGRYGCGVIRAEADIQPEDWFLTCHFVDDKVMPGTLMYECCAHALRVYLQRLGWITGREDVCYEPVIGVASRLKCRGPVTPETKKVIYEVEIRELGAAPEPYAIGDAHMYADGRRIVMFKNLSMKITGLTLAELETDWRRRQGSGLRQDSGADNGPKALYDREKIMAFAIGKPSEAFGEPYRIFDEGRVLARLPGPPYSFMDRVVGCEPSPWQLEADGWVAAEYDVPPDAWYFKADRTGQMPFCVLLEIALQPCGWLAAYMGSALRSSKNLKFRNLGGEAILRHPVTPMSGRLTIRVRATKIAEAAEMIIEYFDMIVAQGKTVIYEGNTYFGFFTREALAQQIGIRGAAETAYAPDPQQIKASSQTVFIDDAPLTPDDPRSTPGHGAMLPAKALRMVDNITCWLPQGGSKGLGFIQGVKQVDPEEWFFQAHFYQDPVCPGSLGVESFLQLLKFAAMQLRPDLATQGKFIQVCNRPHQWSYRGQIIQSNKQVTIEADIQEAISTPQEITLTAKGFVKVDGLYIYQLERFAIGLTA